MKTMGMQSHYDQFTPEERAVLVLAAAAREDKEECVRLHRSCPPADVEAFRRSYVGLLGTLLTFFGNWLSLTCCVIDSSADERFLSYCVVVDKYWDALPPAAKRELKVFGRRRNRAVRITFQKEGKRLSSQWKAFEAAFLRFCGERGLPAQKLFELLPGLPPILERARATLDVDVSADSEIEALQYQLLCDTMSTSTSPQGG